MSPIVVVGGVVFGLLVPALLLWRAVRALALARALGDTESPPTRDGRVALRGRLHARAAPLRTPFFDRPAVSYRYSVAHRVVGSRQVGPVYGEEAQGFVQTPAVLRSAVFEVAILAALHSPDPDRYVDAGEAELAERWRSVVSRLEPASGSTPPIASNGFLLDAPSGALRYEATTRSLQPLDGAVRRYVSETALGEGEEVTLVGAYRARDSALIAIDEILPPDPAAACSRLRGRALRAVVVAAASAASGVLMVCLLKP